jgi:SAM-dependent methyltransferase
MVDESDREGLYDRLHEEAELRFPLEDYPTFHRWLDVPGDGSGLTLLDIACGQGFYLAAAAAASPALTLHGLDFSQVALDKAGARARRVTWHKGSAEGLPFEEAVFDYCVNLGSLEHFEDPLPALVEMRRVLKPDGKALVIVPNAYYLGTVWRVMAYGDADDQGQEGVTTFRTINEWTGVMREAGFDVTGIRGYNGEHHIAWYFQRPDGRITDRERSWRAVLDTFVKPLIPLNLSQCFVYTLRRQPVGSRP